MRKKTMSDIELTIWSTLLFAVVLSVGLSALIGWVLMLVLGALGVSWPFLAAWGVSWLVLLVVSRIGNHAR